MPKRLFGTDGVRGRAGDPPLDVPTVRRLGAALVRALPRAASHHHLLVGRDTRESGDWIARELAHGARSAGGVVTSAGVITTPAVAYLTRESHFDAGVVISASHNPFEDNGIKVFSGVGEKFTERLEREIEHVVADASWSVPAGDAGVLPDEDLSGPYLEHATSALPGASTLSGLRVAVDCANGATSELAPRLLRDLGFDVVLDRLLPEWQEHQPRLRFDAPRVAGAASWWNAAAASASPSTVTAIGRSSWTTVVESWTATRSCCSAPAT